MVWEGPVNAQVHSILVTVAGALFAGAIWGCPLRGLQSRVCHPGPIPHPSQEQSSWEAPGQLQPQALGTSLGMGQGWTRTWSQFSGTHGWAGQGCGEMEHSPALASLGQGLMVSENWPGVLGHGQNEGSHGGGGSWARAIRSGSVLKAWDHVRWPPRAHIPCSLQPEKNQFLCSQTSL